jgi:hypothetical protein
MTPSPMHAGMSSDTMSAWWRGGAPWDVDDTATALRE